MAVLALDGQFAASPGPKGHDPIRPPNRSIVDAKRALARIASLAARLQIFDPIGAATIDRPNVIFPEAALIAAKHANPDDFLKRVPFGRSVRCFRASIRQPLPALEKIVPVQPNAHHFDRFDCT
jgi:hypothetical protein